MRDVPKPEFSFRDKRTFLLKIQGQKDVSLGTFLYLGTLSSQGHYFSARDTKKGHFCSRTRHKDTKNGYFCIKHTKKSLKEPCKWPNLQQGLSTKKIFQLKISFSLNFRSKCSANRHFYLNFFIIMWWAWIILKISFGKWDKFDDIWLKCPWMSMAKFSGTKGHFCP